MDPPPFYRAPPNNNRLMAFQKPAAIPKAPIVNPYDKFTQPQFDSFIADVTGALRGALGYRAELPQKPKARTKWHIPAPHSDEAPDAAYEEEDADEEEQEDEASARWAAASAKGKGRDPREGPGLGRGDRAAPIELDLDSGDEHQEEEEEQEEGEEEEDSWDENEEMGSDEEEEEIALRNGESSARAHARSQKYAERYDDGAEEEEDEYEEREAVGPETAELLSDEEQEDEEHHAHGSPTQEVEEYDEEYQYSDEENDFPTTLLVAPQKRTLVTEEGGYDDDDDGEETGSESENEAGSSPPRQARPQRTQQADDDLFADEDELEEDLGDEPESSRRLQREPEVINLDSDEEDDAVEEEGEEELAEEGEEDEQDEQLQPPLRLSTHQDEQDDDEQDEQVQPLRLSTYQDEQDEQDDDVLPGSSPILSSPVEPEQSFPSDHHNQEVFNVDDDEDMHGAHSGITDSQSFDWNNPPAFEHGVMASRPGHLATPVDEENPVDSDDYPPLEVFGTSDLLPTYDSHSQTQPGSDDTPLQFDPLAFDAHYGFPSSASFVSAPGYLVSETDEGEQVLAENLEYADAYTVSRDISVDPQYFTVEEAVTDQEPDDRGMSLDVVTVDEDMEGVVIVEEAEEPLQEQDFIPEPTVAELEPTEEITSSTREAAPRDEEPVEATLPLDDAHLSAELDTAVPVELVGTTEDPIVVGDSDEPQTNGDDAGLTLGRTDDLTSTAQEDSPSAYPKMTLVPSATPLLEFDPYPYSLSTPGEHPDPMEAISVSSSSAGDGEERTDGERDDVSSSATSQEHETELQYPAEENAKGTLDAEGEDAVGDSDVGAQDVEIVEEVDDTPATFDVGVEEDDTLEVQDVEVVEEIDDPKVALEPEVEQVQATGDDVDVGMEEGGAVEVPDVKILEEVDDSQVTSEVERAHSADGAVDLGVEEGVAVETAGDDGPVADEVDMEEPEVVEEADTKKVEPDVEAEDDENGSDSSETDAHGDDDPDYEDSSSIASVTRDQANTEIDIEEPPARNDEVSAAEEDAPRALEATEETNGDIIEPTEPAVAPPIDPDTSEKDEVNRGTHEEENGVAEVIDVEVPEASGSLGALEKEPSPQPTQPAEDVESPIIADSPPDSLKRKREHFSTGRNAGKMAESRLLRSNGKGKAKEEYFDDDGASSTSSANSAARLLEPGSAPSSRGSSVASAPSSIMPNSSPSLPRMNSIIKVARPPPKLPPPPPPAPPPPPMMHAHSHNRGAHHHPPPMSRHVTQQRMLQRTPSRASIHEESPPPTPSSSSMPAPPPRAPPAAGSPVTRSNCRYHKISLPQDDEDKMGTRVFFVVPGCSLGDQELMKEEYILDLGDATAHDGEVMIKDLDGLNLNPYLIGIIRQLVGVDILREQEVYYLPRPGEQRKMPQKRGKSKLRISSGGSGSFAAGSEAGGSMMSPGSIRSPASVVSSRPPHSAAGSSSTVSAQTKRGRKKGSPTPSWQGGDESTDEDDESPAAKKIRAAEEEGIAAAASGSPLRTRRSKRMDREAAEYKPDPVALEAVEESSEEEEDKGKRKKKRRGVKRGRQSEATPSQEGGEERKTKKLRTHESIGGPTS
ncbi:hypothetical protein C8R46DRAFT_1055380 [Mycena filopes]|nr:hypothetical protein C8R46DRAFT_1055380 [Mycena filopes]